MELTVKFAGKEAAAIRIGFSANGRPCPEGALLQSAVFIDHIFIDHNIRRQLGIGRGIAFVDMGSKPVQLTGIADFIVIALCVPLCALIGCVFAHAEAIVIVITIV